MSPTGKPFDPDSAGTGEGIFGLPHRPEEARVVLIPVPWEATVSYGTGTAGGPETILQASRQVELRDHEAGTPYEAGICLLPISEQVRAWNERARRLAEPVIAAGGIEEDPSLSDNVREVDALGAELNAWTHETASTWRKRGKLVGLVGGDHSAPFGAIQAAAEAHPGLGILHVDAHADLRPAYEGFAWSHASIFHNVYHRLPGVGRIVQVGVRDVSHAEEALIEGSEGRVRTFFDLDLRRRVHEGEPWGPIAREIVSELPRTVYVSFDIDGLDPSLCPHTGTPVPGGMSFAEAIGLLRATVESGRRIVGFDLCEVAPDPTGATEWDGNVGARVLYKLIGYALKSLGR